MRLGFGEILVILVVVLLIFGANKIPQLGDALGKGIRNFKKAQSDDSIDVTPGTQSPEQLSQGAARTSGSATPAASEAKKG